MSTHHYTTGSSFVGSLPLAKNALHSHNVWIVWASGPSKWLPLQPFRAEHCSSYVRNQWRYIYTPMTTYKIVFSESVNIVDSFTVTLIQFIHSVSPFNTGIIRGRGCRGCGTVPLITVVSTVIIAITHITLRFTLSIVTGELVWCTLVWKMHTVRLD